MIDQISTLELRFLVQEFQQIIGAKVDKAYMPSKRELDIRLHVPGVGKKILRIALPGLIYLSDQKQDYPDNPHGFAMFVRKRLGGARIREISQHGSERIAKILFETKDSSYTLVIELFSKGNVILIDRENTILNPLERQIWKDREVKTKATYVFPERSHDIFTLSLDEFSSLITLSKKSLVKAIATDLALGGVFAEEVCRRAGLDKSISSPTPQELRKAYESFSSLISSPLSPHLVIRSGKIFDILPIDIATEGEKTVQPSFNHALDSYHSHAISSQKRDKTEKQVKTYQNKYEKIIDMQTKRLKSLHEKIEENRKRGELIYEHFQMLTDLLAGIEHAKKTMSWNEIREKAIAHPQVVDLDTKKKTITLELD